MLILWLFHHFEGTFQSPILVLNQLLNNTPISMSL